MRTIASGLDSPSMFHTSLLRTLLGLVGFCWLSSVSAQAQTSVTMTTNFYAVTGATFREIRASIAQSRPWKESFDGDTRWDINWRFTTVQSAGGCTCSSFSTATKITITLPRWTPPVGVETRVKEQWTRYYTNLAQHELGHARIGLAAAGEVQRRASTVGVQPDCAQLKQLINDRANQVIAEYRRRDVEYDERTDHGRRSMARP